MYKYSQTDYRFAQCRTQPRAQNYSLIRSIKDQPIQLQEKIIKILENHKKFQETDYFKTEPNIIFNHKPIGPKLDKNDKLIPYSFVGPANLFNSNNNTKKYYSSNKYMRMDSNKSLNSSRRFSRRYSSSKKIIPRKFIEENRNSQIHFLNSNSLLNIYNEIKKRINYNKKKYEKEKSLQFVDFPKLIKKNILKQENILTNFSRFNKQRVKVEKKLLKRTLKGNTQELLINKSNEFIIKNQINIYRDKNEDADKKYGDNLWNITLRNPNKNGEYERIGYQNIGSSTEPKYTNFNLSRTAEFCSSPGFKSKVKIKQLKNLVWQDLEVKGENLLDFESKKEVGFKGKKIYYKPGEIDCLLIKDKDKDKDKPNEITEEDKINYFGEKIYAENFNKKDYYKDQSLNNKYTKSIISSNI